MLANARWAEARGLVCFALPDHYLRGVSGDHRREPAYDTFPIVGGLARETNRIRLSVLVAPITFRHPAVLGKNAVTLDDMSGGRFTLGVGTGWLEAEHEVFGIPFPPSAERWERMEEALGYLRALFTPGAVGFEGRHYRLEPEDLAPVPGPGLQIVVGGTGPRITPTLAGRYADEYNIYPAPRAEMERRIEIAREAAAAVGREFFLSSSGLLLVGRDDADYRRKLTAAAAALGETVDALEAHFARRNTPRGTASAVRETLAMMGEIGVRRFYVQALGRDTQASIEETFELIGA